MRILRAATHNICHMGKNPIDRTELFPDGSYRNGYAPELTELMKRLWWEVYGGFFADQIGLQEYCPWFDLAGTVRTQEQVFAPFGYTVTDGGSGLALASRFPAEHLCEGDFAPVSSRRWQKFRVDLGGVPVTVFNCHPMPRRPEIRQQEYAILLAEFAKEETFVAFGDFNARTAKEYEVFRAAGYAMANHGLVTVENGCMCDNIVASPNFSFSRIQILDPQFLLSDHAILLAELTLE